jgi:hypothetical protein
MALANPASGSGEYSADQSAVYKLDLSEVLANILLDDTDILGTLGISGETVKQTKHSWVEDALNATTVITIGDIGAADVVFSLSGGYKDKVTAGTLLKDTLSGKPEVVQVTAYGAVSATIVRGYGNTSGNTHPGTGAASATTWEVIANARPQGMAGPKDESTTRALSYNYTQIFSKGVKITGTAQAIEHAGVSAEDSYQIDLRLRELKRELDRTIIMGAIAPNDVAATTYGTMGGLIDLIGWCTSANRSTTAETLTPSVLNAMAKAVFDKGGEPDIVLVGAAQKQKISLFDQEFRRSTLDSRKAGYTVEEFVTDLGRNLRIVVDRWVPSDVALVLDSSKIKVMPLQTRAFALEKLAKTGDSENWQIVGEYTMEVRNADKAHYYHNNLKA